VHLETREKGGLKKYYLAHSLRKGNSVRKIRVYLGVDLSQEELDKKRKRAEVELRNRIKKRREIPDPFLTVLSPSVLKELATLEAHGDYKIIHLSESDWDRFKQAFTYDTNAIEGSLIEHREVGEILRERKWPEDASKVDISETYGVSEAIDHIRETPEHLSLKLIKDLHRIVFKNSKSFAGKFREKGVEVVIADVHGNIVHRGAPSSHVRSLLNELIRWYIQNKTKYPPLVLAAVVHNQFEIIHPFKDGNGRVGRLLLNNILIKHNLPPLNIELKNRSQYYATLQAYEKERYLRPTFEIFLKEYRELKKMLK